MAALDVEEMLVEEQNPVAVGDAADGVGVVDVEHGADSPYHSELAVPLGKWAEGGSEHSGPACALPAWAVRK